MTPSLTPQPQSERQLNGVIVHEYLYQNSGSFTVPPLAMDQISLTLDGGNIMSRRLEGRTTQGVISPGSVTIVPRGEQSVWTPQIRQPSRAIHILIPPQAWVNVANSSDTDSSNIRLRSDFATEDALLHQVGTALAQLQRVPDVTSLYVQALTEAFIAHLFQFYMVDALTLLDAGPSLTRFRSVIDYIEAHLVEDVALDDLARVAGMSSYHFSRAFKAETGLPPHQYLIVRRVERAKTLIERERLPLSRVASQVGFSSQSHLTRHFKRIVGVTPGQYRDAR